jgi:hypothetical protein
VLSTVNGMSFASDGGESSRGRLGVAIRKSFGDADTGWLWTPYVTCRRCASSTASTLYAINDLFLGEIDDRRHQHAAGAGLHGAPPGWSIYGGLNWADGGSLDSFFGGQLGVRYTFGHAAPPPPPPAAAAGQDLRGPGRRWRRHQQLRRQVPGFDRGQAVGPDGCPVPEPVMEAKPYRN